MLEIGRLQHEQNAQCQKHPPGWCEFEKEARQQPERQIDRPAESAHSAQLLFRLRVQIKVVQLEVGTVNRPFEAVPLEIGPDMLNVLVQRPKERRTASDARFRIRHTFLTIRADTDPRSGT